MSRNDSLVGSFRSFRHGKGSLSYGKSFPAINSTKTTSLLLEEPTFFFPFFFLPDRSLFLIVPRGVLKFSFLLLLLFRIFTKCDLVSLGKFVCQVLMDCFVFQNDDEDFGPEEEEAADRHRPREEEEEEHGEPPVNVTGTRKKRGQRLAAQRVDANSLDSYASTWSPFLIYLMRENGGLYSRFIAPSFLAKMRAKWEEIYPLELDAAGLAKAEKMFRSKAVRKMLSEFRPGISCKRMVL